MIRRTLIAFGVVLALSINGWGCTAWGDPPPRFSIDSEFSPEEREAIRAAFAAWCDAVGYCPQEVLFAERGHIELVDDLPEGEVRCPPDRSCTTAAHNMRGDAIEVARSRNSPESMTALQFVVQHEIGHYCTEHTETGLMAAIADLNIVGIEIDDVALDAWRDGCPDYATAENVGTGPE